MRGKFITFEGGEGSGKTTQIKLLSAVLTQRGIDHIVTREPGGTPLAEKIRPLLVENLNLPEASLRAEASPERSNPDWIAASPSAPRNDGGTSLKPKSEDWDPLAETLLFLAARIQHWRQKIAPALAAGQWVLCDRFMDSTLVYQGIGKGLGVEYLAALHRLVLERDCLPDLTLLLDIDPQEGLKRAHSRQDKEGRFEALDLVFHEKLRAGFLSLAQTDPNRFHIIPTAQAPEAVHREIVDSLPPCGGARETKA